MTRTSVASVAMLALVACSAPKPRPSGPLVESTAPESAACSDADWRSARVCADQDCVGEALGGTCSTCLEQMSAGNCAGCLGEQLCRHPDNLTAVADILAGDAEELAGVRFQRVGKFPIGGLEGASRNGKEIVIVAAGGLLGESRSSAAVGDLKDVAAPLRYSVLTDDDELLWQIPGSLSDCLPPRVSPMGRWLIQVCEDRARVYELASGMLHHEVELAVPVESPELLDVSHLGPLYHAFGGDNWLVLPAADGLRRIDLDTAEALAITPPSDAVAQLLSAYRLDGDDVRVSIAWDGTHIAVGKQGDAHDQLEVFTVDGARHRTITAPHPIHEFSFDGARNLVIANTSEFSRLALDGTVIERDVSSGATDQIAAGRAWWVRRVEPEGADVTKPFGRLDVRLDPTPPDSPRRHEMRGLLMLDTVVVLDDGRFVGGAPAFGITFFDADGEVQLGSLGRGSALWLSSGEGREVVIGHDHGVRAWNVDTFDSRALDIPAEFALTPVVFEEGWMFATGSSDQRFTGLERDENLLIVAPDGTRRRLTLDAPIQSLAAIKGTLHVATRTGIDTVDLSLAAPTARPAHRFVDPLEPVKGESATFSADGAFALVLEDGKAKLYRTTDYSRSIDTFDAATCAFARDAPTVACLTVAPDRSVRLHSHDLAADVELASHSADSSAAKALSVLRVVDCSADGRQIVLGRGNEWIAIADLETKELLGRRGKHAAFVGVEVASTDGVYLFVEQPRATAATRDPLPD